MILLKHFLKYSHFTPLANFWLAKFPVSTPTHFSMQIMPTEYFLSQRITVPKKSSSYLLNEIHLCRQSTSLPTRHSRSCKTNDSFIRLIYKECTLNGANFIDLKKFFYTIDHSADYARCPEVDKFSPN